MTLLETRAYQLFPVLDPAQVGTAKRFASGAAQSFAPGETVFAVGARNIPIWLVLDGSIKVVRRDGLAHEAEITTLGIGQFSGELSQQIVRLDVFGRHDPTTSILDLEGSLGISPMEAGSEDIASSAQSPESMGITLRCAKIKPPPFAH